MTCVGITYFLLIFKFLIYLEFLWYVLPNDLSIMLTKELLHKREFISDLRPNHKPFFHPLSR